jgi:hypothetical protein
VISFAKVLHSTTPYDLTVTDWQIEDPAVSTMDTEEDTVTPGTEAVINDPPIDPEFGETETSFGVRLNEASTSEWPSGIPTSKNSFWELSVWDVTSLMVNTASVVLTEVAGYFTSEMYSSTELVSPVRLVPVTLSCHWLVESSNTRSTDVTSGIKEVHVKTHLVFGSQIASSEVFKKTAIAFSSPPVFFKPVSILHLIYVAEVSWTKQSMLPTPPLLLIYTGLSV